MLVTEEVRETSAPGGWGLKEIRLQMMVPMRTQRDLGVLNRYGGKWM